MLQRVALQTKLQLKANEDSVPDVTAAVQELLTSLFTAVYNHQDEEGRCFSDSMQELPEHDDVDGKKWVDHRSSQSKQSLFKCYTLNLNSLILDIVPYLQ